MSHSFALLCSWMDRSHFGIQPQFMVLWAVFQWSASHPLLFSFMPPNSVLLSYIPFLYCDYISSSKPCLLSFLPLSSLWPADCPPNCTISVYRNLLYLNNPWPSELQLEILYFEDFFKGKDYKLTNTNLVTKYIYRTLTESKTNECIKSW